MSETARFRAVIEPAPNGSFVALPDEAVRLLGATKRTSVTGALDGHPITSQVMPYSFEGIGKRVVLGLGRATREAIGKAIGDEIEVVLGRDDRSRSANVEIPAELAAALAADPTAKAAFEALAPSRRREHAGHVAEAKGAETRERRAARVVAALRNDRMDPSAKGS